MKYTRKQLIKKLTESFVQLQELQDNRETSNLRMYDGKGKQFTPAETNAYLTGKLDGISHAIMLLAGVK